MDELSRPHDADALEAAQMVLEDHGIDFRFAWQCSLDDLEAERSYALMEACRAYALRSPPAPGLSEEAQKIISDVVAVVEGTHDHVQWFGPLGKLIEAYRRGYFSRLTASPPVPTSDRKR